MNLNFAAYRQVLKSYVGMLRTQFLIFLPFLGLEMPSWLACPALMLWLGFFLTMHVSWRLQSARGRLAPGYRRVHLAGLATVYAGAFVLLMLGTHFSPFDGPKATAGAMVLACGAGCWGALKPRVAGALFGIPVLASLWLTFSPTALEAWNRWSVELMTPGVNLSLALAGIILLALTVRGLRNLTDDDAAAARLARTSLWDALSCKPLYEAMNAQAMNAQNVRVVGEVEGATEQGALYPKGLADYQLRRMDERFDAAVQRGCAGWAWNTRRWLLPSASVKLFVSILVVLFLIAAWCSPESGGEFAWLYLFLGPIVAVSLTTALMMPRRRFLAIESLRPVTRGQFFRQLGAGVLAQSLAIALVIFAGLCLLLGLHWQGDWRTVQLLGLVLGMLLVEMAMLLWLARFRRMQVAVAAVAGLVMLVVLLVGAQRWRVGHWVVAIAVVEIVAAVLAVWAVYRQWLVTDLD